MARRVANTKHFKISKLLSEKVRLMSPNEMLPTIAELKRKYNSSQVTIIQALDRLRLQGLIERPSGKKRLVVTRRGTPLRFQLCLVRPLWPSPDYDSIMNRIYEMGQKEHIGFGFYIYSDVKNLRIEQALKQADAGLLIGDRDMTASQIEEINGSRKPIVFLRDKPRGVRAGSVWVDDIVVGQIATKHLLSLGHRRIAVMLSEPYNPSSMARMQGWRAALTAARIQQIDSLVADCSVQPGTDAMSGSYGRFSRWLDSVPRDFTAMFCVGWTGALAVLRAFREHNIKVPEDVSVITYASESPLCDFSCPRLTTVQLDNDRYAREAISLVEKNLAGADSKVASQDILLEPQLVVRESTMKLRR